jgi:aspartyl-tRNA(Asn)/glutamyl-tRNA(Gln) amidotransferase subunit B
VRRPGAPLGTRCEIKNLNSFRFMEKAIEFEVKRQIEILEDGGKIVQETRLYDSDKDETRSMRSKEDAQDYRYFPDPDLLPLEVSEDWLERVRKALIELPQGKRERYQREYGLSAYDAELLTQSLETAEYFEVVVAELGNDRAKIAANWITREVLALVNKEGYGTTMAEPPIAPLELATLIKRERDGTLNRNSARTVLQNIALTRKVRGAIRPDIVDDTIRKLGLKQMSDVDEIEKIVDEVLAANAKQVEDYRAGKDKAFNSLVGQVMKASKGKANPAQVNEILKRKLGR